MPRFTPLSPAEIEIAGTGTSASTVALLPAIADRVPCVEYARITATPNDSLDFYNGSNLMKSFPADGDGIIEILNWGPGVDNPTLTYPFTDNMTFGYRMTCGGGATAWRGPIKFGWAR